MSSVPTVPKVSVSYKCSVCNKQGHNKKTCKENVVIIAPPVVPVVTPPVVPVVTPPVVPVIAPLTLAQRIQLAPVTYPPLPPSPPQRIQHVPVTYPRKEDADSDHASEEERSCIKDYDIQKVFTVARVKTSSILYDQLRDYYHHHPEAFRRVNDSHYSNGDETKHFTVSVSMPIRHHATREIMRTHTHTLHVYFNETPMKQREDKTYKSYLAITTKVFDTAHIPFIQEVASFYPPS